MSAIRRSLFKCYHLYYLNTAMSTHRYKTLAQTSHNLILTSQDCSIVRTIEFWLTDNLWINPYKNSRICGVLYTYDCSITLMINCYMPCDTYTVHVDENYVDTLNTISHLLYSYNPSHVVIGDL